MSMNIKVFVNYQDDTGWHDISAYIKYDTLSITHNAFSTSYKYAQNECSFGVIYDSDVFPYMSQTHSDVLLRIIDLQSGNASDFVSDPSLFFTCETLDLATALFYGHIPNTKSWDYNGIADNTIVSVEATDDLDYLDVPIGDLVCSSCEVLNPSDKANSLLHYLLFKGNWGDEHVYKSDFSTDSDGWSATNGTIAANGRYLALAASGVGAYVSRTVSFSGKDNPFISFDVSSSGNNPTAVKIYYSTSSHGYSDSYYKSLSFSDNTGTWSNLAVDMSDLTAGGTDWSDNTITGIKILLDASVPGGIFNLHNIIVGNVSRIVSDVTISTVIEKFAPDSEDDSLLTTIDTLLYEYGYSLSCNAMGYISPVKWSATSTSGAPEFNDDNIAGKISVKDAVKTYDSVKLTYYYLNSADNIRLYTDSNCSYDDDGILAGYDILNGYYYPADANAIDTSTGTNKVVEQEYTDDGISYATNYSVMNNLDYDYSAFSSDFSSIVATGNHYMDRLEDNGLTHVIESFGNKKCRLLYRNTSGSTVKLYANNVYGTVWYKSSAVTNELDLVTVPKNIYGYTADYIYDDTVAEEFTAALAAQYNTGLVTFTFSSDTFVSQGTLTHLYSSDAGISIYAFIRAVQYDNSTEQYSYTCVSCSVNRADLTRTSIKQIATVNVDAPYLMSVDNSSLVVPFSSGVGDYSKAVSVATITQNGVDVTKYFTASASATDGISGTLSGYTYTVTGMTVASGTITITLTKNSVDYTKTITVTRTGEEGVTVSINATGNVFSYDSDGNHPSPVSSVVTATLFNYSGTVYYEFLIGETSVQNTTSNAYTYTPQISYSNMPQTVMVKVHKASVSGDIIAIDSLSMYGVEDGPAGYGALTYLQKNASQSVPATSDGTVSSYANTNNVIRVFEGDTELQAVTGTPSAGQYKVTAAGVAITAGTVSVSGLTVVVGLCSAMTALQAYVTYTITGERADGTAFSTTLQQNITKAVAGTDGGGLIQISNPDSTTPESSMVYDNTYYSMWQGSMYLWTWNSSTTGYWTQVSADTPPTPAVRYSFDEMPDLPDKGNATYYSDFSSSVDGWSPNGTGNVVSYANSTLIDTYTGSSGWQPSIVKGTSFSSKLVIVKFKSSSTISYIQAYTGSASVTSTLRQDSAGLYTAIFISFTTTNFILYFCQSSDVDNVITIYNIYVGDGTTSQPIIDNISGACNSTAQSGVVSCDGVSGKACQFLGYRAIKIPVSKYANVQSYYIDFWLYIDTLPTTIEYVYCFGSEKEVAFINTSGKLTIYSLNSSNNGLEVSVPYNVLSGKWTHIICTTEIASSSSTTKKLYVNGILYQTSTTTFNLTAAVFGTYGYIGGSSTSSALFTGCIDNFIFNNITITATESLGSYLQRASAAKLYTLADLVNDNAASDGIISRTEKSGVLTLYQTKYGLYTAIIAQAASLSVSYTAMTTAYNNLYAYLYTSPGVLVDFTVDTTITTATYQALWTAFDSAYIDLQTAISKAQSIAKANAAQTAAQDYADDLNTQLAAQTDHAIVVWKRDSTDNPADDWTTDALKTAHNGDYWKKTDLSTWGRYARTGTNTGAWSQITDSTTITWLNAADTASSAASAAAAAQSTADNISVGGTNLVDNSETITVTAGTSNYGFKSLYTFTEDGEYTFSSLPVLNSGTAINVSVLVYDFSTSTVKKSSTFSVDTKGTWTFTLSGLDYTNLQLLVYAGVAGSTSGNVVTYNKSKLEKGNKATDWSPSIDDVNVAIAEKSTIWPSYAAAVASAVAGDTFIDSANTLGKGSSILYVALTALAATYKRLTPIAWGSLSTAPTSGMIANDTYYNSASGIWYYYSGSAWVATSTASTQYSITANNGSFTKTRANVVTPTSITVTAHATTAAGTVNYSGRLKFYYTLDGSTYVNTNTANDTSQANEFSHTYTIPTTGVVGFRVELYLAGGFTTLLASQDYDVPYDANVAPIYFGAVSTMPTTSIIKGDTVLWIGSSGTYTKNKVYQYSGSAWSVLDYTLTANASYYMDALKDILANNTTSTGYFDAVFCNAFFANSASIAALQTKTIVLTSSGVIKTKDYNGTLAGSWLDGTAGFRLGYEGNADFNGSTHIGGTLTVDGVATLGSGCSLQGYLNQNGVTKKPLGVLSFSCTADGTYNGLSGLDNKLIIWAKSSNIQSVTRTATGIFFVVFNDISPFSINNNTDACFVNVLYSSDKGVGGKVSGFQNFSSYGTNRIFVTTAGNDPSSFIAEQGYGTDGTTVTSWLSTGSFGGHNFITNGSYGATFVLCSNNDSEAFEDPAGYCILEFYGISYTNVLPEPIVTSV